MGNCGFTLAPCRAEEADLVMRNLERAEDISRAAMKAGIKWRWETFPQFLDVLESLPKGINYAGYVGHCAIRTHVMGQRAFTDEATEDDLKAMIHHTREAVAAGAHGFSTTRSVAPPDLGRQAGRQPARHLARVRDPGEVDGRAAWSRSRASRAAPTATRRAPTTRACASSRSRAAGRSPSACSAGATTRAPGAPPSTSSSAPAARAGACSPRCTAASLNVLLSFETQLPFDKWEMWRDMRKPAARRAEAVAARSREAQAAGRDRVEAVRGPGPCRRRRGAAAAMGLDLRADRHEGPAQVDGRAGAR